MKCSLLAPLLALFPIVLGRTVGKRADYAVKSSHFVPSEWLQVGRAEADHPINLRIGLKQAAFHELERHLYEVSDPSHARYGQHLSADDIHPLVAPTKDALNALQGWLKDHDILADDITYSHANDWASLMLPVHRVEYLLATEYHTYRNSQGEEIVRAVDYSLPAHLHEHIDTIQPTNHFSSIRSLQGLPLATRLESRSINDHPSSYPPNLAGICNRTAGLTSLCVRTLYETVDYTPRVPHKNSAGVAQYQNQTPSDADFKQYMSSNRKGSEPGYGLSREIIANAFNDQSQPGDEANLDVQIIGGIAYPTPLKAYLTGGAPPFTPDFLTPENTNEPYLTWLNYILHQPQKSIPKVISTSYGDYEETVPRDYAIRVCAELAQLGARGVTLLFASGDFGVGFNGSCTSNDGTNRRKFQPEFPGSCPYVTTVGGTFMTNPEVVVQGLQFSDGTPYVSGSGFSEYFPRPKYQDAAVSTYLSNIKTLHNGLFNRAGRAYPDIAAQGDGFQVILEGKGVVLRGTSVSAPVAAGVLTLVNDALIAAGKSPLGFLNPLLYATSGCGFTDIKKGRSTGCETDGFPATKGWDVASGWGTPDFKAIREHLRV